MKLNDNGQIIGNFYTAQNEYHAFLYSDGQFRTINIPGCSRVDIVHDTPNPGFPHLAVFLGPQGDVLEARPVTSLEAGETFLHRIAESIDKEVKDSKEKENSVLRQYKLARPGMRALLTAENCSS